MKGEKTIAKPIEATPMLEGADDLAFIAEMEKNEKASKEEKNAHTGRCLPFSSYVSLRFDPIALKNIQSLEDYITNEVYKLCSNEEIKLNTK